MLKCSQIEILNLDMCLHGVGDLVEETLKFMEAFIVWINTFNKIAKFIFSMCNAIYMYYISQLVCTLWLVNFLVHILQYGLQICLTI